MSEHGISNLSREDRVFEPPADLAAQANVTADVYDRAAQNRLGFWADAARRLTWGTDFDEQNNPFECRLGKWCDLDGDHDFLAKEALLRIREQGPREQLVGLHLASSEPLPGAVKPMQLTQRHINIFRKKHG